MLFKNIKKKIKFRFEMTELYRIFFNNIIIYEKKIKIIKIKKKN